jgi:hypothetical protein
MTMAPLLNAIASEGIRVRHLRCVIEGGEIWEREFAKRLVLGQVSPRCYDEMTWQEGQQMDVAAGHSPIPSSFVPTLFSELTVLDLHIACETSSTGLVMGSVVECLKRASVLEELTLQWPRRFHDIDHLQDQHWPKLRSLVLRGIATTHDDLCSLLERHAFTLRSLGLHHLRLNNGSRDWPTIICRIPELLSLESVTLRDLSHQKSWPATTVSEYAKYFTNWEKDGVYERAVEDYILRGGKLPNLNKELFDLQIAKEISSSLICPAE